MRTLWVIFQWETEQTWSASCFWVHVASVSIQLVAVIHFVVHSYINRRWTTNNMSLQFFPLYWRCCIPINHFRSNLCNWTSESVWVRANPFTNKNHEMDRSNSTNSFQSQMIYLNYISNRHVFNSIWWCSLVSIKFGKDLFCKLNAIAIILLKLVCCKLFLSRFC